MKSYYLIILLLSLAFPLGYTIFKRDLIKDWKALALSTSLVALAFLAWDNKFTHFEVWGFNDDYCLGLYFGEIPLEEILFFLIIPFCSLFIHFALIHLRPRLTLTPTTTRAITIALLVLTFTLAITNWSRSYTVVNFSILTVVLILAILFKRTILSRFYISFLIILGPFLLVNGALTGAFTDEPVVWYDNHENIGIRLITIPLEDIGYAFSMLMSNLILFDVFRKKSTLNLT
jgi:lycopene cyclase domain-containing protein